jgi:hypothetical protein
LAERDGKRRRICFDITGGTKPLSVAGAVLTMGAGDHTFLYVTGKREFVVFDARIALGQGIGA